MISVFYFRAIKIIFYLKRIVSKPVTLKKKTFIPLIPILTIQSPRPLTMMMTMMTSVTLFLSYFPSQWSLRPTPQQSAAWGLTRVPVVLRTPQNISEDFISIKHLHPASSSSTVAVGGITIILRTRLTVGHFVESQTVKRKNHQQHSPLCSV